MSPDASSRITAPVVCGGAVYVSSFDGAVSCFDASNGQRRWRREMNATSAPWVVGDAVYVAQRTVGAADHAERADVGFSEGRDVTVDYRTADRHPERLPTLAAELVRRRPAVIIANRAGAALALKAATQDIPIIFNAGIDPVEVGLVASLNRPGGNLTGISHPNTEFVDKRLQLLHQAVPAVETIALLVGGPADNRFIQAETRRMQSAARTLGLRCWFST